MSVPYELKKKCVEMANERYSSRYIFDNIFHKAHPEMSFNTFKVKLVGWKKQEYPSLETLINGTYEGFTAHSATVQVDSEGNITQAWIKQSADSVNYAEIIEQFREVIPVENVLPTKMDGKSMLEIPLFDMHFGVADFSTYREKLAKILEIITCKDYDEINILFGQDMLHTNDMRGNTASGTQIGEINFQKAWADAWNFWHNVLYNALQHASKVKMIYSKGNHDECASWCLFKALEVAFPQATFDDSMNPYKVIHWKECFIGVSHGNETKKSYSDYRGRFTISFPKEFADSKVREIHLGHLHCESEMGDAYGVLVRRLSSSVPTDNWTLNQGFIGAHKRFMIFEWLPGELSKIHYI